MSAPVSTRRGAGRADRAGRAGRAGRRRRDDRGTLTMFVAIFIFSVFVLAGLVFDGGLVIDGRQRAADVAEQAARRGADTVDIARLRSTGQARIISAAQACARAEEIIDLQSSVVGRTCSVQGGQTVVVGVTIRVPMRLLTIVGITQMDATGTAEASVACGITTEVAC